MRPQLVFNAPSELTIFYRDDETTDRTMLSGSMSCTNMSALGVSSIDVHISLMQVGTFKKEEKSTNKRSKWSSLSIIHRSKLSHPHAFDKGDEILSTTISLFSQDCKKTTKRFEFNIPPDLPPTTDFPTFSISYALVATSTLPWSQVLKATQPVRISRRPIEPIPLQPTPTAYSHAPLALCVNFDDPDPRSNHLSAKLHLSSAEARLAGSLEWEVDEIATITTPDPAAVPMSQALRIIDKGSCVYGPPPPTPSQHAGTEKAIDVPFTIAVPEDTEFPKSSRTGSCVLDAWSPTHARCEKMGFEVRVEQKLRIRLHLEQDGNGGSGGAEGIYSVVLPLEGLWAGSDSADAAGRGEDGCGKKYCITRESV